jgi:McbB family protein
MQGEKSRLSTARILQIMIEQGVEDTSAALAFLQNIQLLLTIDSAHRVEVTSVQVELAEQFSDHLRRNDSIEVTVCPEPSGDPDLSLVVVIQGRYSQTHVRRCLDILARSPSVLMVHGYFVLRHFVIDGIYSGVLQSPDHFSSLSNLAGLERPLGFKPTTWADIYLADPQAVVTRAIPTIPPSDLDTSAALHLLYCRVRPFLSPSSPPVFADDLSTIVELNLDTGNVSRHRGFHSMFESRVRQSLGGSGA